MKKQIWIRKCQTINNNPNCTKIITYKLKHSYERGIKNNTTCRSCGCFGRIFTDEHKQKLKKPKTEEWKEKMKGPRLNYRKENHPFHGKLRPNHSKFMKENNPSFSIETRKKQRISHLKNIENRIGQVIPNYNPIGCKIINEYGKKYGYNFQHAENGGELCIGGYYPDGIDLNKKVIIEIDESRHYINDKLLKKDIDRQLYLESLGYKVIRIKV